MAEKEMDLILCAVFAYELVVAVQQVKLLHLRKE